MTLPADFSHAAWLIDLDGTLYAPRLVQLGMAAELLLSGPHRITALRAFRHQHEALRRELAAEPARSYEPSPYAEQLARAANQLGVEPAALERIVSAWMLERPGKWLRLARRKSLLQAISAFRAQGGKTALVSDYPAETKLRSLGARELFDLVVANGEHPRLTRLKPAPDGMRLAAEELGVPASRCLVLGDRADADGRAASAAGMAFQLIR